MVSQPRKTILVTGMLLSEFPDLVKEYLSTNDRKPEDVAAGSHYVAKWQCSNCQSQYLKQVRRRTGALQGCPSCAYERRSKTFARKRNSLTEKTCAECKKILSIEKFRFKGKNTDVRYVYCEQCRARLNKKYLCTVRGHLRTLLSGAKSHALKRLKIGRIDAGVFAVTIDHLLNLWETQQCKCYYSGIQMTTKYGSDWCCSIERLDPSKGYIVGNTVLCCQEFNNSCQWSNQKFEEAIILSKLPGTELLVDLSAQKRKISTRVKSQTTFIDDIEHFLCIECETWVQKVTRNKCSECRKGYYKRRKLIPRGYLSLLVKSASNSTVERNKKGRNLCANEMTLNDMIALYETQNGLCHYTGIRMRFPTIEDDKNWIVSLERLDSKIGYAQKNCVLICREFNTSDRRSIFESEGSGSWSKEKWNTIMTLHDTT